MSIKKIMALTTAVLMTSAALSGCKSVQRANISGASDEISEVSVPDLVEVTTEPVATYPDYPISYPAIEKQDTGDLYEAEACALPEGVSIASEREDFSGDGYVHGFGTDGSKKLAFNVEVPSNQHYDLSFSIASDAVADCTVFLNDTEIKRFKTVSDGKFTLITLYGIFFVKGASTVEIRPDNGDIDLDYLRVSDSSLLSEIKYEADGQLSNPGAGESASRLMSFLTENYGKSTLTGQYVSDETNSEIDLVYRTTGKYPVIRFAELENSEDSYDSSFKDVDAAAEWYKNGGIVGLMWEWKSPGKQTSVYAKDTDFRLADAVTDIDIAKLTQEEIRGLYGEGKISSQCYGIILDIDDMAGQLISLKNKGVPVLWRPLYEASGDWFWWGASGAEDYKWLWQLLYTRMTDYFKLDNLIWIWNGQSSGTLVDSSMFDIASADIYLSGDKEYGSSYEQFAALQKITGTNKLISISECGCVPDIDACFRDNSVWSFFGLWYGDYIQKEDGSFSDKYITKDEFIHIYNSDGMITLDEYKELMADDSIKPTSAVTEAAATEAAVTEAQTESGT